jgi:hypothetical protein
VLKRVFGLERKETQRRNLIHEKLQNLYSSQNIRYYIDQIELGEVIALIERRGMHKNIGRNT